MRKGNGDGGVVGEGGWVELRGVSGVVMPPVSVQSKSLSLHAWVRGSMLLDVVRMMRVRPAQHQPPAQSGKAGNRGIRDGGALHAAGCRLGG